jgi:hypothetical protein
LRKPRTAGLDCPSKPPLWEKLTARVGVLAVQLADERVLRAAVQKCPSTAGVRG